MIKTIVLTSLLAVTAFASVTVAQADMMDRRMMRERAMHRHMTHDRIHDRFHDRMDRRDLAMKRHMMHRDM